MSRRRSRKEKEEKEIGPGEGSLLSQLLPLSSSSNSSFPLTPSLQLRIYNITHVWKSLAFPYSFMEPLSSSTPWKPNYVGIALSPHRPTPTNLYKAINQHRAIFSGQLASPNSANSSQTTAAENKEKESAAKPQEQEEEIDIDLEAPETEKAALAIQNQFRRFQKKKK
ncbi:hypothetical protein Q8A73_013103 [Channa argus]|nr:hypothetical protein Q8A73_013103 [Channa argus]